MTVLVSIPYGGQPHPDSLQRCVQSVLAQTHGDIACLVVGDGMKLPRLPKDDRLVLHEAKTNRGCYFVRQAMLLASPFEWHAPVDSDDWVDPEHLDVMFDQIGDAQAALPRQVRGWVEGRGPRVYGAGKYHVGLLRSDRMLAIGGYGPHERIGQDTLMYRILALTGPIVAVTEPVTYNRIRRPGSLTMARETRHRSPERFAMQERNRAVFYACKRLRDPKAIREYRESRVPDDITDALMLEVDAISRLLGSAEAVAA